MHPGDPSHLLGKVIDGRYEILQCIGEGGMGVVYKARQTSIDRMVAIKMLSGTLARDRNWVQRFYNEAKACSRLHHPNTIRMFDFGQTRDGQLFMAMEFLDGQSLRQVIANHAPLDPQRVMRIVVQCCASLSEAHNFGIIHRDIKGDNVFLIDLPGSPDHVKLLDFGVAKLMQAEDFATQVGVVFGTPQYMSPEQGRGEPLKPPSDLYGVGILTYEMLTCAVPFSDPSPMTVLQMHMQSPVPPLPPHIPGPVQALVMRALEKDPGRRFPTAAAMMEEAQSISAALAAGSPPGPAPRPITPGSFPAGPRHMPHAAPVERGHFPPGPSALPPHAGSGNAGMQTVLDGSNRPAPVGVNAPSASPSSMAAAAARTILVGPSHPPVAPEAARPPVGGAHRGGSSSELRTVMLPPDANESRPAPENRGVPMAATYGATGGAKASALFWIVCLLTGLAVGIGAYWLVLELGR